MKRIYLKHLNHLLFKKMDKKDSIFISSDTLKELQIIIDYLLDSEQKHYEEHISSDFDNEYILSKEFYNNPDINHIYAITRRVQDALNLSL